MLDSWLIRHGQTEGNKSGKYIGVTDEPLCVEGIEFLKTLQYPEIDAVFVSPKKRCLQTAQILFPEHEAHVIPELAECDFGEFENKNYKELSGNQHYQQWIDSNGMLPFPGGESRGAFKKRCFDGFGKAVQQYSSDKIHNGAASALPDLLLVSYGWIHCCTAFPNPSKHLFLKAPLLSPPGNGSIPLESIHC